MNEREQILALAGELKAGSNWLSGRANVYSYNRAPKQAAALLEIIAEISIANLLIKLRAPDDWRLEGYGHFKDVTSKISDAPFRAADVIESFYHAARKDLEEENQHLRMALADTEALELSTGERCKKLQKELEARSPSLMALAVIRELTGTQKETLDATIESVKELRQQLAAAQHDIDRHLENNAKLKERHEQEMTTAQARISELEGYCGCAVSPCNHDHVAKARDKAIARVAELEAQVEPVAWLEGNPEGIWFVAFTENPNAQQKPLYLHTPQAVPEWQPIETAPKGTNGYSWMQLAWGPDEDKNTGHGMRANGKFYAVGTFYCLGQERQYQMREIEVTPTHWMPLPAAPSPEGEKR